MRRLNNAHFYGLLGKYFLADQFDRLMEINDKFFMEAASMQLPSEMIEQYKIVDDVTGEPITPEQRAAMFKLIAERKNIQ